MTTSVNNIEHFHLHIWNLLPWYSTDSLEMNDHLDVEQHLAHCHLCQKELNVQQSLHLSISAIKSNNISTAKQAFAFNTVMQQISKHNSAITTEKKSTNNVSIQIKSYHLIKNFEIGSIPYSIAASFVIAISVSIILLQSRNLKLHNSLTDNPLTANLVNATKKTTIINQGQFLTRITFKKGSDKSMLQSLLTTYQGKLVSGPDSHGIYTIDFISAVNSSQQFQRLLDTLTQRPEIILINAINQSLRGE